MVKSWLCPVPGKNQPQSGQNQGSPQLDLQPWLASWPFLPSSVPLPTPSRLHPWTPGSSGRAREGTG